MSLYIPQVGKAHLPSVLATDSIVPNVIILVVQRPLHDLRRLFNEVQEFWSRDNIRLLLLGEL
jgi:hypothetical protein